VLAVALGGDRMQGMDGRPWVRVHRDGRIVVIGRPPRCTHRGGRIVLSGERNGLGDRRHFDECAGAVARENSMVRSQVRPTMVVLESRCCTTETVHTTAEDGSCHWQQPQQDFIEYGIEGVPVMARKEGLKVWFPLLLQAKWSTRILFRMFLGGWLCVAVLACSLA